MKKKQILFSCLLLFIFSGVYSQSMNFNSKVIKLIPDETYLPKADWKAIFYDEAKMDIPSKVGLNKQIRFGPDGCVFISDRSKFTITKLNNEGKVETTFGKKGWNNGEFANNQELNCIFRDELIVVSDNQGRINFFDLEGNFVKLITIDFMPQRIFPLKSGKLIVWGYTAWKGHSKHLLAELDYETGTYDQIYETLESNDKMMRISIPTETGVIGVGAPYSATSRKIKVTGNDKIIFALNSENFVNVLSKVDGSWQVSKFKIGIKPIPVGET